MNKFKEKKLQVFISSTYEDLKIQRRLAIEAILKLHHIPAGMETFDPDYKCTIEIIKDWIDECDVFLIILGEEYGSIEESLGKSYVEIEFDYALERKKPVIACSKKLISDSSSKNEKFTKFRSRVREKYNGEFSNDVELNTSILIALTRIQQDEKVLGLYKSPFTGSSKNNVSAGTPAFEQYLSFKNHEDTFSDVTYHLEKYIEEEKPKKIELRFITVAMCFSFPYIECSLMEIANKNPNIHFHLNIVATNHEHLSKFQWDAKDNNWLMFSKSLKKRLEDLKKSYLYKNKQDNWDFDLAYFNEIPQRHGIMLKLEQDHLFQSVSDWSVQTQIPRLSVGTNEYRHFDSGNVIGKYWTALFNHWFHFYLHYEQRLLKPT